MAALGGLVGRFLPRRLKMLDTTVLGIGELGALFLVLASHGSGWELIKQELKKVDERSRDGRIKETGKVERKSRTV